ncbi:failed axon connections homolog isoform X1 [Ptychodera flava]|uniref:failed axon connections homolog isoform X1 n=1 Tax=Ptychodera flava TaxID=63121 RepID=UPI00396A21B7
MTISVLWTVGAIAAATVSFLGLYKFLFPKRSTKGYPKDTVILRHTGRARFVPSMSPFPIKLETYLRFAKIPYVSVFSTKMSPKNKIPWIEFNGVTMSDSNFIIEFLNDQFNVDLSKHLSPSDRAIARAFQKMMEEDFYWTIAYSRWVDSRTQQIQAEVNLPRGFITTRIVPMLVKRNVKKSMHGHGIGRHSEKEIYHIAEKDLRAVSDFLGNKLFLFGDEPCEEDCAIFGQLAQALWQLKDSPQEKLIKGDCKNLQDYCHRMRDRFWPDWDRCTMGGTVELRGFVYYPESDPTVYKPNHD